LTAKGTEIMPLIYLIRHGENEYVGKGKLAGSIPGIHLNEKGLAQAQGLAALFSKRKVDAVYSSPLERTLETAKPLADSKGLDVVELEGLGEVGYGRWEGQSLKALRRRKLWPLVQYLPSLARFPEGESFFEAQSRATEVIEELRIRHKRKRSAIACVTHADIIKLILAHYIGLPLDLFQRLAISPGSVSTLHIDPGIHLLSLNETPQSQTPDQE
jgi:probable phosphoglycerate mutase